MPLRHLKPDEFGGFSPADENRRVLLRWHLAAAIAGTVASVLLVLSWLF